MHDHIRLNDDGAISMHIDPAISISPVGLDIDLDDRRLSHRAALNIACDGSSLRMAFDGMNAVLRVEHAWDGALFYTVDVENNSGGDLRLRGISLRLFDGDWGACGPLCVSSDARVTTYPAERAYGYDGPRAIADNLPLTSCWFVSVHDPRTLRNIASGAYDAPAGFVRFHAVPLQSHSPGMRVLRLRCDIDTLSGARGVRIPPSGVFSTRRLFLSLWKGALQDGMDRIGARLGLRHRNAPLPPLPNGWCSWYAGYETAITEEDVFRNLAVAATLDGMDIIQIDDGWTAGRGTRSLGEPVVDAAKFPGGMRALAQRIRAAGKSPGLWLRPFEGWGDDADAPDWARGACIDLSHPDCLAWLRDRIGGLVHDWGYQYLKLDFLAFDVYGVWGMELLRETRARLEPHDDSITTVQMFRRALAVIRETAGPGVFLLGCNVLLGPALGLVDGMRIGDDVSAANWDRTVTMGMTPVAPMEFLHGRVWHNDADCMLFHAPMTMEQVKEWNSFIATHGLCAMVSSKLHELPLDRMLALQSVFPVREQHRAAIPDTLEAQGG
ncbi:MAG: alpha-galactosidase [Ignavibacteria bacterium]|nr:alpha-galactosidase [Ignavibacteria bacterium]